jgi:hypothetical protein
LLSYQEQSEPVQQQSYQELSKLIQQQSELNQRVFKTNCIHAFIICMMLSLLSVVFPVLWQYTIYNMIIDFLWILMLINGAVFITLSVCSC